MTLHGKPYFLFSDGLKRWSFQKIRVDIWSFLYYRKRLCFFFQKIWSDTLEGKWKMIFLKKKYTEIWHFLQTFLKDGLFRKGCAGHDLSCIISKDGIFFPKTWYFFLGQEVRDDLSQEIHRNMISWCHAPLPEKSKMVLSRKNAPKGDWRSRLTS